MGGDDCLFGRYELFSGYRGRHAARPAGYSVFVGLGTAGTAVVEILLFGEPIDAAKIFFISTLLVGVIGLKLVTPNLAPKRGG